MEDYNQTGLAPPPRPPNRRSLGRKFPRKSQVGGPFPAAALCFSRSSLLYTLAATALNTRVSIRQELPTPESLFLISTNSAAAAFLPRS